MDLPEYAAATKSLKSNVESTIAESHETIRQLEQLDVSDIKYSDLQILVVNMSRAGKSYVEFSEARNIESKAHQERIKNLISLRDNQLNPIKAGAERESNQVTATAVGKITSIHGDLSKLMRQSETLGVNLLEGIPGPTEATQYLSRKPPESPIPSALSYQDSLFTAQMSPGKNDPESRAKRRLIGYWVVGISIIVAWIVFGSFSVAILNGIGIATLTYGIFEQYIEGTVKKFRQLNASAIKECVSIYHQHSKEQNIISSNLQEKLDPHGQQFSEYEDQLKSQFRNIKDFLNRDFENIKQNLSVVSKKSGEIIEKWKQANWEIATGLSSSEDRSLNSTPATLLRLGEAKPNPSIADTSGLPWFFNRHEDKHLIFNTEFDTSTRDSEIFSAFIGHLLVSFPPGQLRFLFIDPIGLGDSFSDFHVLSDFDDNLVSGQVWSARQHIREQLEKVVEHIGNVVQSYLRSDFNSIDEYNNSVKQISEPYRFVFISGFPEGFDSESILALERILANGARCGVHVVMTWDRRKQLPHGVKEEQILQKLRNMKLHHKHQVEFSIPDNFDTCVDYLLDSAPPAELLDEIAKVHGKMSVEGAKVEIPFEHLMQEFSSNDLTGATDDSIFWAKNSSKSMIVPLGFRGANKIQFYEVGKAGTAHHTLLIGKTGSGKSNLLHVMIMAMAELYSPEELELYLIDFKEGVEFKDYAEYALPHARVVAIDSEAEFGLSVLRGIQDEMIRRGRVFKEHNVQKLDEYREISEKVMPRAILIIDEFQKLISSDDQTSREAKAILEELGRKARSYGIHLVLSSQTIAGLHLPKALLEQLHIRIAMQCSESDSRFVLADDNPAARMLNRVGEGIYNDKNGLVEGNSKFQTALLTSAERRIRLEKMAEALSLKTEWRETRYGHPYVFEGHAAATIENCSIFQLSPNEGDSLKTSTFDLPVGEPLAMLPTLSIKLKRQSGAHVLVVHRNESLAYGVVCSAILGGLRQQNSPKIEFVDLSSADSSWNDYSTIFQEIMPEDVSVCGRRGIMDVINSTAEVVRRRVDENSINERPIFLVLFGLQRARDLRQVSGSRLFSRSSDEGPDVHKNLSTILRDGPDFGVHIIAWCDTYQSVTNHIDNSVLVEFGHRIAGGLSSSESSKLLDGPVASNITKENRMVAYDDESVGVYHHFRPFLPPDRNWLKRTLTSIVNNR